MAFYNSIQEQIKSGGGITLTVDDNSGVVIISSDGGGGGGGGGVTAVSGTDDRIMVNGSLYVGQTTINTLGDIAVGTWGAGNVTAPNVTASKVMINANNNVITLSAPSTLSASINFTLPSTIGAINQSLVLSDNNGTMSWKKLALSDLSDCNTNGAAPHQMLVYNNGWNPYTFASSVFSFNDLSKTVNASISTGVLSDVTLDFPITKNQVLSWQLASTVAGYVWRNRTLTLGDGYIGDVVVNSNTVAANNVLQYNGTNWVNSNNLTLSGILSFKNSGSSNSVSLQIPTNLSSTSIYTLPSTLGSAGQTLNILSVAGNSASLNWTSPSAGFSPSVSNSISNDLLIYNSSSSGWSNLSSLVRYKKLKLSTIYTTALSMIVPSTSTVDFPKGYFSGYEISSTNGEAVYYSFTLPYDYKLNTAMILQLFFFAKTKPVAGQNSTTILLEERSIASQISISFSLSSYWYNVFISTDQFLSQFYGASSINNPIGFYISRTASAVNNYSDSIYLVEANLIYQTDSYCSSSYSDKA